VYFVHSYEAKPADDTCRAADTLYGGRRVCAAVQKENVWGCQFHPEKSGEVGLQILKNYVRFCEKSQ
jgi:glutamine amidotransferase